MNIKVFTCGGTFEKVYNPISGELGFQRFLHTKHNKTITNNLESGF